jgi:hypothetical protein
MEYEIICKFPTITYIDFIPQTVNSTVLREINF